ncbi:MAG: hypothetical protein ACI92C_001906 [Neolewinella sp.]|jgi:hypothetical protein
MENINLVIASGLRVWLSDSPDIMTLQNHVIYNQHSLKYTVLAHRRALFKARETLKLVTDELE